MARGCDDHEGASVWGSGVGGKVLAAGGGVEAGGELRSLVDSVGEAGTRGNAEDLCDAASGAGPVVDSGGGAWRWCVSRGDDAVLDGPPPGRYSTRAHTHTHAQTHTQVHTRHIRALARTHICVHTTYRFESVRAYVDWVAGGVQEQVDSILI